MKLSGGTGEMWIQKQSLKEYSLQNYMLPMTQGHAVCTRQSPNKLMGLILAESLSLAVSSVQSLSHVRLFATPWMDYSTPSLPVHHQLPGFTQTHVHWVSDAIQSSHPLSFPSREFFTSGGQSIRISASTSVLPMYIQGWFPLEWTGWIFLQSKGLSRVFSNTTVQKHQFFGAQLSLYSSSHIHAWLVEKKHSCD